MNVRLEGRELVVRSFGVGEIDERIVKVVRLAMAAGLWANTQLREGSLDDRPIPEMGLGWPDGYASELLPAMICLVAEIENTTPERMIEQWRKRTATFERVVSDLQELQAA